MCQQLSTGDIAVIPDSTLQTPHLSQGGFPMKRVFSLLLALLLLAAPFAHAAGFVNDAAAINEACLSVMKLEVKNDNGVTDGTDDTNKR